MQIGNEQIHSRKLRLVLTERAGAKQKWSEVSSIGAGALLG
jgi:hypothetical protein